MKTRKRPITCLLSEPFPPTLKAQLEAAEAYVQRIGAPEYHTTHKGSLSVVVVDTQIQHQEKPGARVFFENAVFDTALAEAVRLNFAYLAPIALALMSERYIAALQAERDQFESQLNDLEREHKARAQALPFAVEASTSSVTARNVGEQRQ